MSYDIKVIQESVWFVGIAIATYLAQLLAEFEKVEDWETYLIAAGVGLARVVGAAILNLLGRLASGPGDA